MIWQTIAEQQERVIEELIELCGELISELSQYKNVEAEEEKLKKLEEKEH